MKSDEVTFWIKEGLGTSSKDQIFIRSEFANYN